MGFSKLLISVHSNFYLLKSKKPNDPTEFFNLFETMLIRSNDSNALTNQNNTTQTDDDTMLDTLTTRIESYDINDEERVLTGYLKLIKVVVSNRNKNKKKLKMLQMKDEKKDEKKDDKKDEKKENLDNDTSIETRLIHLMFDTCLFRIPTKESPNLRTLCSSRQARKGAFDVL